MTVPYITLGTEGLLRKGGYRERRKGHWQADKVRGRRASGGDPAVLVASSDKIIAELGWSPEYSELDGIIDSAWKWHSAHPKGYGDSR